MKNMTSLSSIPLTKTHSSTIGLSAMNTTHLLIMMEENKRKIEGLGRGSVGTGEEE